jgi:hypothetical protein
MQTMLQQLEWQKLTERTRRRHAYIVLTKKSKKALKKLIIDSFEYQFLNALSNEVVGYANRMSLDLLTHLLTYYAMIAPTELTQNYAHLNTPYDPNQAIDSLFQKIQDARAFMIADGNTGLFLDACRAWQVRPEAQKMRTNFKVHFTAAHRESRLTNHTAQ